MENEDKGRKAILEKIRKLFSLAENNPSEKEALSAALKAQKLMADNDVSQRELHEGEGEPIETAESELSSDRTWRYSLAKTVADNFRCKYFLTGTSPGRPDKPTFYGYRSDAQAALLTYEHLYRCGDRLAKRAAKDWKAMYGWCDGIYNQFAFGFVEGVKGELEKQALALMIVCPPAVNDAYADLRKGFSFRKPRGGKAVRIDSVREGGRSAGRDAVRAGRIGKGEESLLTA